VSNMTAGATPDTPDFPDIQAAVGIAINRPRSLSITDPHNGYPKYTGAGGAMPDPQGASIWNGNDVAGEGAYSPPLDVPLDYQATVQINQHTREALRVNGKPNPADPTDRKNDFRRVHLQRLANPLKAWHPKRNPYLTIDSMSVPLTVFNGVDDSAANPDPISGRNPDKLATHQRGDEIGTSTVRNIWFHDFSAITNDGVSNTPDDGGANVMGRKLQNTLGRLNYSPTSTPPNDIYGPPFSSTTANLPASPYDQTLVAGGLPKFYVGAPDNSKDPFPWLTWNNRPYVSAPELMLVSACQSSRMAREATVFNTGNPFTEDVNANKRITFGHLLNFFNSDASSGSAPNIAGIFDYLRVPSQFIGTETVLSPKAFEWNCNQAAPGYLAGEVSTGGNEPNGTAGLHPPFNTVSNHREPGRVNINTINSPQVWINVVGGQPGPTAPGPAFGDIRDSRQGYTGGAYAFDNTYPSIFGNPFRSTGGADMVPIPGIRPTAASGLAHKPINVTLFRATGVSPTLDSTSDTPLLAKNPTSLKYDDYRRSAYFYFQPLNRLANKLTTHSNVYAVWVTVGYFEVSANSGGVDAGHPDGYQLGQELGSDTGEIERHRGFYIIDRSIPVGFQRGQDLNSNDTVLLKRFIE